MRHYVENIQYVWLRNQGRDHVEKIKVSNLLEYHYLESKQENDSYTSLKELPSL